MDEEHRKRIPSVPSNFLTLAQLQERWLQKKQREKEEEEDEARRQQRQKEEEEEEKLKRREQRKLRIQQARKWQADNRERPRSNNVPRPPFHRNRRNQSPAGDAGGDNEMKPERTHIGEVAAEEAELKPDASVRIRTLPRKMEPICRNRQNQRPAGDDGLEQEETHPVAEVPEPKIDDSMESTSGPEKRKPYYRNRQFPGECAGDSEVNSGKTHTGDVVPADVGLKIDDSIKNIESTSGPEKRKPYYRNRRNQFPGECSGKTHIGDVAPEDVGLKIDDSIKKTGPKKRGKPRASAPEEDHRTDDLLPENRETTAAGKGRIGKKKVWGDGSGELERNFGKVSLSGGGEGLNGRPSGHIRGGHRNHDKGSGGVDWPRRRNSNLVWVKKDVDSDVNAS